MGKEKKMAGAVIPSHIQYLTKHRKPLYTSDGYCIELHELTIPPDALLSGWASHFRFHYCLDTEIDFLRAGTGLSRAAYLTQLIFPDETIPPGPSIRAGDFAEFLISDYVEYLLGYFVPREKYAEKAIRNESVKGVDILGFLIASPPTQSRQDRLLAFEAKAQLSNTKYSGRLQDAINDSSKDYIRRAMTLNATKRRLLHSGQLEKALIVQRFQNIADHPYEYRSGAAAVLSDSAYDEALLQESTIASGHQNAGNLDLIVIRGTELMKFVNALYERAANEA